MNIQAMMKQAQKLQQDMVETKKEIDSTLYEGKASFITVEAKGNHTITKIKIDKSDVTNDDLEMIEDLLVVAVNEVNKKIEKDTEQKMGKHTKGMPGLF